MVEFNAALLSLAAAFTGPCLPWQAIRIQPHRGGVLVAGSDEGKIAMIGWDPRGRGDESLDLVASSDLIKAANPIKTADREVSIDGDEAQVTTYRKIAANEVRRFPIQRSLVPLPSLSGPIARCVDHWGAAPAVSGTAGRYALPYLERAIKAAGHLADSIVLSSFNGGPLRLQCEALEIVILVLPMTAEPIPSVPTWLQAYGDTARARP